MTSLGRKTDYLITEAAMEEEGATIGTAPIEPCDPFRESLEENLVEVAFAEAADYEEIHLAIIQEHLRRCAA